MTLAASLAMIGAGLWVWLILFRGFYWQDDFSETTEFAFAPAEATAAHAPLASPPDIVAILPVFPKP